MNLLLLVPAYPHPGDLFGGAFNHRCAVVLRSLCEGWKSFRRGPGPRRFLRGMSPRWSIYAQIPKYEVRDGISVFRPGYLQVPRINSPFWSDQGSYLSVRNTARRMHRRARFDAILSFDMVATGSLAWRLGRDLGIPAASWSTQSVPITDESALAPAVRRAVSGLDLMFYQSREKLDEMARFLGVRAGQMPAGRHRVLARGVPEPPRLLRGALRSRIRAEWGISDEQILVLAIGRIDREKGVYELFEAVPRAVTRDPRIRFVLVGSRPALDETRAAEAQIDGVPALREHLRILPACSPERVWELLCASDIYAFPSQREGMPNSLLEAMSMGLPAVATAIPPVEEIDGGSGAIALVPPLDPDRFADALVAMASDSAARSRIGAAGEAQVRRRFDVTRNMTSALAALEQMRRRWRARQSLPDAAGDPEERVRAAEVNAEN